MRLLLNGSRSFWTAAAVGLALLAVAIVSPGVANGTDEPSGLLAPPRGGMTVGGAGHGSIVELVAAQSFQVQSVAVFDLGTQRFLIHIPGAPAAVNTLTDAVLTADTLVWVRRPVHDTSDAVVAPAVEASSAPAPGQATLPVPRKGGLTVGVVATETVRGLIDAQGFAVESVLVWDRASQRFLVYIPGAPSSTNTLSDEALRPGSVVWIRRPTTDLATPPVAAGVARVAPTEASGTVAGPAPTPTRTSTARPTPTAVAPSPASGGGGGGGGGVAFAGPPPASAPPPTAAAGPTSTPTATPTPTPAPKATASPTPTPTPKATASPTPTLTPKATASPTPPSGCESIPPDRLGLLGERQGFGRDVTGGAGGCLYRVTNANASGPGSLHEGARLGDRWIVFEGDYTINICNRDIALASNTTIDGRGRNVTITGGEIELKGQRENIIISDVTVRDSCSGGRDLLDVSNGGTRFWFHHLRLAGASDEYINVAAALEGRPLTGTISWVHFERASAGGAALTRELTVLIGDGQRPDTNHLIRVTVHHNFFDGTYTRNPSSNGAMVHLYNNVISWRLKGVQAKRHNSDGVYSAEGANIVSESDVYDARYAPEGRWDAAIDLKDPSVRVRVVNPLELNGARTQSQHAGNTFNPGAYYTYSPEPAAAAANSVPAGVGPR